MLFVVLPGSAAAVVALPAPAVVVAAGAAVELDAGAEGFAPPKRLGAALPDVIVDAAVVFVPGAVLEDAAVVVAGPPNNDGV